MLSNYSYTPGIWPSLVTVLLLILLAIFSGRRRSVPGALPFMIACILSAFWAFGSVMEIAAVEASTKIAWFKFQGALQLPSATAITCFVLDYAWPGRWLTRRNLILLSIPCLLAMGMILFANLQHLLWRDLLVSYKVIPLRAPVTWVLIAYAYLLALVNIGVFAWLFIRSPQHRWPVVIMIAGLAAGRTIFLIETSPSNLSLNLPPVAIEYLLYAIALFGFRIFDPIALARSAVITQMPDGVFVLDLQGRVASHNPAASRILGSASQRLVGEPIQKLLPVDLEAALAGSQKAEIEFHLGAGADLRFYTLDITMLNDWQGFQAGSLLLLQDVTVQRQAQAQLLEQQRALAMQHEREQLAREMHDGIGQVLGYVRLQAQAARDLLAQDQKAAADASLAQLVAVAQDANADIREYLFNTRVTTTVPLDFLQALEKYLAAFSEHYRLRTDLIVQSDWRDDLLEPTAEAQLLRIIQEACSNARKHAQAQRVQVKIQHVDNRVQVLIQDDGIGFDPSILTNSLGQKYGLVFMRQRAEEAGGLLRVESSPGQGTSVIVEVPVMMVEGG